MKLQTMFRNTRRSDSRRKPLVLRKLRKRSRGILKEESMRSLRTDISSDASTAYDPAELDSSVICCKQHQQEMDEEQRQDAAIVHVDESSKTAIEVSTRLPSEPEQTPPNELKMVHLMNSFLCFGNAPLPELAEVEMEEDAENNGNGSSITEEIIRESVECIYSGVSDMARIEPAVEVLVKNSCSSAQTTTNGYSLPPLDPKLWPQAPLLFRAAPNSGTEILGIRRDDSKEYLWTPTSNGPWWHQLDDSIGNEQVDKGCWILPINDGTEAVGKSLVIDFESKLFRGSLLIRLKDAPLATRGSSKLTSKDRGFFANNAGIRYQVTVQGRFKRSLQWSNLLTGLRLQRKFGKAPPKWFLWTALKVVHFFAPQLQTKLDGDEPYALSPLGSAPRTVTINKGETAELMGIDREEPTTPEESLTGKAYPIKDPLERARARKRDFDSKFKAKDESFCTGVHDTYTFQFMQHLLDYHTSSIDLGSFHHDMNDILGGQPFQVMAEHNGEPLWMFEIWNESILENTKRELAKKR